MDYQKVVDSIGVMTCVISVEKKEDGSYGTIRIVTGNKAYIDSIEGANGAPKMLTDKFVPNSEYETYFTKDLNFEDFCYRSAILKQPLHSYVRPERYDFWFNMIFMPLESDDPDLGYCLYTQEFKREADSNAMGDLSHETATDVLKTCIKLRGTDNFRKAIVEVIADIRRICKAKYCCIMQMDFTNRTCELLGESMEDRAMFSSNDNWMDEDFFDMAETWADIIGGSNCLILKNRQDMEFLKEKNPAWYESMTTSGVHSMVLMPLKFRGELNGYIWVTNFDTEDVVRIKETLELTTFILASEIANNQMINRLQILSSIDLLTGLMNRNSMNNRVEELSTGKDNRVKSVGVVFTDMNGLKRVNDNEGHQAGDLLLKNAAMLLQNVFIGAEIYRAGGDEFMILVPNASKDRFEKMIEKIREATSEFEAGTFAIGAYYEPDVLNVRIAMGKADRIMMEQKQMFYDVHPDLKRN